MIYRNKLGPPALLMIENESCQSSLIKNVKRFSLIALKFPKCHPYSLNTVTIVIESCLRCHGLPIVSCIFSSFCACSCTVLTKIAIGWCSKVQVTFIGEKTNKPKTINFVLPHKSHIKNVLSKEQLTARESRSTSYLGFAVFALYYTDESANVGLDTHSAVAMHPGRT